MATAWLAGMALLAGAVPPQAHAQTEETAMAIPRLAPFDGTGVALPEPLATTDAALLRRLFADKTSTPAALIRRAGGLDAATPLNDRMLGHLLAVRYLASPRRASLPQLTDWLGRYAELPDAAAIATLLHRRDPTARLPATLRAAPVQAAAPVPEEAEPAGPSLVRNPLLDSTIRQRLHAAQFESALRLIGKTRGLNATYAAMLRAEVAQAMFTRNRDEAALALARDAVRQGHGQVGLADYVAGLAAWRLGQHDAAMAHFAAAAVAPIAPPALRAAGGFWTARACLARHDAAKGRAWLAYAGTQHHTFYGQLARRVAGRSAGLSFRDDVLGEADIDAVAAEPGGLRAFALLQIGQPAGAEAELRQLGRQLQERPTAARLVLTRAVMLVAEHAGLFDLAADLAATVETETGQTGAALDSDRFPIPRLRPRHGFLMDPALVYALTRIESNFDTAAVSAMGAEGLMQIMPRTASYVANSSVAPRLHDPAVNLDLGQRYVANLAGHDAVSGDLIRVLASYNSGPAAFGRWSPAIEDHDDPLLFMEAIPNDETRAFVQRALAYTWIYAARLHLAAPSLDALAAGRFPRFSAAAGLHNAALLH